MSRPAYDVLVIGGGPAGLSAALMLGRCRWRVLLCDDRLPRNRKSHGIHGLLSRDGIPPARFLALARRDLATYPTVESRVVTVRRVRPGPGGFLARLSTGSRVRARRVVLATGVVDRYPRVSGFDRIYGRSAHHCPYCDGWEWRDRRLVVYGRGAAAAALALKLRHWSADLVVCTDGPSEWTRSQRRALREAGIGSVSRRIARLRSVNGMLTHVVFQGGTRLERDAMFFTLGQTPIHRIAAALGCRLTTRGTIRIFMRGATSVAGIYAAGDLSTGHQFVATALAQGVEAAVRIHESLVEEDRALRRGPRRVMRRKRS